MNYDQKVIFKEGSVIKLGDTVFAKTLPNIFKVLKDIDCVQQEKEFYEYVKANPFVMKEDAYAKYLIKEGFLEEFVVYNYKF